MSLCTLHYHSPTLGKHTAATIILPDSGDPPFPTFYLLHGLSDDHTIWLRRTRIESYAGKYPFIIVMPDGGRGFYTNHANGPAWATHIGEELVNFIDRTFPTKRSRGHRCIGGLSMGGYGALRLSLAYPQTFSSATSHSGAVLHGSRNHPRPGGALGEAEFRRIFGDLPVNSDHDIIALAKRAQSKGPLPHLRIDCGLEDDLITDNRKLHHELAKLNVHHDYQEFPGAHNWDYWDTHVQDALAFHARNVS